MAVGERVLRVGSALPDPPFEIPGPPASGLDVDWMRAVAAELGARYQLVGYDGDDFEGIFARLGERYDAVASGATVTDHRRTLARWCRPYLRSGQSLVVNTDRTPDVHATGDLAGLVLGVQEGNTSEPVARRLHAEGGVAGVRVYPYEGILDALDDLDAGRIGGFMKLEPVMRRLTEERPSLAVVQTGITTELIAVAVASGDAALAAELDRAQDALRARGTLAELGARWLADSDPAATAVCP
ncbi:ABC transporter substrate-binding protein [Pseudonocardia sp.]|uniref:ABC transporter substrate-binding protein n=1 Tax=Pseudonocardia sp. TaxID=60912 RepID=UPI003D1200D1